MLEDQSSGSYTTPTSPPKKKQTSKSPSETSSTAAAAILVEGMQKAAMRLTNDAADDEIDVFAKYVATELRGLKDADEAR